MTEPKWTKGPWEVDDVDCTRVNCADRGEEICDTRYASEKSPEEIIANAQLIASAPRLYEALERAQEELRLLRMKDTGAVYDTTLRFDMQAALRAARGES